MKTEPLISVVIPAYNEAARIGQTLASIRRCKVDFPYEVIVVDNGSADNTGNAARDAGADRVLLQPRRGPGFARQMGFEHAGGEILACTDADTLVAPDWLNIMARAFARRKIIGIYGPVLARQRTFLNILSADIMFTLFLKVNRLLGIAHFTGMNFAITRKAFDAVGGYDPGVLAGAEVELCQRAQKEGRIMYHPGLKVYTDMRRFTGKRRFTQSFRNFRTYIDICWLHRPPRAKYTPVDELKK